MDYREHIHALAAELGVPVIEDCTSWRESQGRYSPIRDKWVGVHVAPLDNETAYLIALHELGHVATTDLSPGSPLRIHMTNPFKRMLGVSPEQLDAEAEAWHWALDHCAVEELSVGALAYARYGIDTYREEAPQGDTPRYLELIDRL